MRSSALLISLVVVLTPTAARSLETQQDGPALESSIDGAGGGLWSDTCEYYNPKDRTDASITHPDVWNGHDTNGNPEGLGNQLKVSWFDEAHTQIEFRIGAYGVNRARSYGYTKGYLYTMQNGSESTCASKRDALGNTFLQQNKDLIIYVTATDPKLQVSPGQKVDFAYYPYIPLSVSP